MRRSGETDTHFEPALVDGATIVLSYATATAAVAGAGGTALYHVAKATRDSGLASLTARSLIATVAVFALHELAKCVIAPGTAWMDLQYKDVRALSTDYQGGVVAWVAFWAVYRAGFGAANIAAIGTVGVAFLAVVLIEPPDDLAVLALAKALQGNDSRPSSPRASTRPDTHRRSLGLRAAPLLKPLSMTTLLLIGIGTGNPDHITGQAIKALNRADLILIPRKGEAKSDLADLRRQILAQVLTAVVPVADYDVPTRADTDDYLGAVNDWHDAIAQMWADAIATHPTARTVALMVWGDPSLYDSTLRIAARLAGVTVKVIPGITSLQALTAAHAIPLNTLAAPVSITTGRQLRDHGWPAGATTLAVMLDKGGAFTAIDPKGTDIWWAAYVGMAEETLIHGPLAKVSAEILATRARLRAEHGWIMDIYLLRRGGDV